MRLIELKSFPIVLAIETIVDVPNKFYAIFVTSQLRAGKPGVRGRVASISQFNSTLFLILPSHNNHTTIQIQSNLPSVPTKLNANFFINSNVINNKSIMSYSYLLKYIIIGDQSVGKSCLLMRFIDDQFKMDSDATIGVEFGSKTIKIQSRIVKLQIWDTAGQEAFRSITRSYYRGTIGVLLVYDITSISSFESVGRWLEEAKNFATNENIEVVLVGNKSDLGAHRAVSFEKGAQYAKMNQIHFIESSAKSGYNASYCFQLLTEKIIQKVQAGLIDTSDENGGVRLGEYTPMVTKIESKGKCC